MLILGHRGFSDKYPENTMIAFEEAIKKGFNGIETDVHKTKDGKLVLCHDEKIDRTSDGTGYIKDLTYAQLCEYNFNNKMKQFNQKIPLLIELLELCKDKDIVLNVELKTDKIHYENIEEDVYEMIKELNMLDKIMFSSFNIDSVIKMRELDNSLYVGYLFEDNYEVNKQLCIDNNLNVHPDEVFLNDEEIKDIKSHGLDINTWTVKNRFRFEYLKEQGVDVIISNKFFKEVKIL